LVILVVPGCVRKAPPAQPEIQAAPEPEMVEPAPPVAAAQPAPAQGPVSVEPLEDVPDFMPVFREPGVVRVGFLAPLSGPRASLGTALFNAAQLALFDHAGESLTLVPKDTNGTAAGAAIAMQELIAEGVDLVIGPLLGDSVRAVAPIARPARVPVVAFSNDRSAAGDGVFIIGFTPGQQIGRVVAHAVQSGHRRIAALVPHGAYGDAVVSALYDATGRSGVSIARIEYFTPGAQGDAAPVQSLVAAAGLTEDGVPTGFDALLIAASGESLRGLALLFPYYDLDPSQGQVVGTEQWKEPSLLGEPALLNGWFAAAPDDGFAGFRARYQNAFGTAPPRLATLGYDAVIMASDLAGRAGGADFGDLALTDPTGFTGADGKFRLGSDGVAERALTVYRVAPRSFEVRDPAPSGFGTASF
jgi:ABC-type branched-subunit amino acid transport system substrate-binding protein